MPAKASAVVDPLAVDGALTAGGGRTDAEAGGQDRIDPRAVGPFRLPESERKQLAEVAAGVVSCMHDLGVSARTVQGPSGRPRIEAPNDPSDILDSSCRIAELDMPTRTESKALDRLNELTNACLRRADAPPVKVGLDLTWWQSVGIFDRRSGRYIPTETEVPAEAEIPTEVDDRTGTDVPEKASGRGEAAVPDQPGAAAAKRPKPVPASTPSESPALAEPSGGVMRVGSEYDTKTAACVGSARREQLGSYVSEPALLFVTSSDGSRAAAARADANGGFSLSAANTTRLAGFSAGILAVTVAVTAFAATRLTRPLRALTAATQRMKTGEATEPVTARSAGSAGEIRQLADAFNDMAAHRKALEDQRQAMVSDVAHELRTPLSNIRGWLEAAEDGVVATDPELVTSLLEEALLLQHIVNDLQDLAAADAGTLRLHREPVHASDVVDQVAAAHQAGAEAAGVRLSATTLGDPCFTADPLRLRQAIGNLVSNAVRHTPAGGSVTISCRATLDAVVVEVADTGSGIAPADLPHVFDRFWRADKSRTRATGGSGLGLAIVRQLVEGHGGTVTARSTPGEGAVFTVRVPVE